MGGVAVGVMALIVVLAVMSGFEDVLKHKIVGTNAHVVVLQLDSHRLTGLRSGARAGATGTARESLSRPFVYSQVMLSSRDECDGGGDSRDRSRTGAVGD